ncbi:hypothetical protein GCM10011348_14980 [Marinobacterium nitratireducens]|uniref:TIR domain-containing protein n=1 Tax=Marinobacterium nitratireducens TaxID=518897 RepID=A0A917ZD76_9GAMM|nr:TIR domain-containing protein [Marinobacterium nitratireducens]GGO79789.1 hypothetical protein GCM10011348_14980 [Marinobacterium nitratireducens]
MAAIFISHSSADNEAATELAERLRARGFHSLFLDFDPEQGIPGGRSWERELYSRLRSAQAVLVLCSPESMASNWVFAEITHARALGKPVVPLRLAHCELHSILRDVQRIDFAADREAGFARLWRALGEAGLDPSDPQSWQADRPPYPGLAAFDEDDSAVFFGRDDDIRAGIETLNRIRRFGGAPLLLFLGPSGSGKSSLVRAGILPRLRRNPGWRVLEPIRPRSRALATLAAGLAPADHDGACRRLADGDPQGLPGCLEAFFDNSDSADTWLVLVIDQLEELFDPENRDADRLVELIRLLDQGPARRLILVGVMRSDFLDDFQSHPVLKALPFQDQSVRPLALSDLHQVIAEPARLAGIELEPGLVERMIDDTGSSDALPLLAFALRELWENCGRKGRIGLTDYETELGGISGSIRRAADGVLAAAGPDSDALDALHAAFRRLVRINEEGQYARRVARLEELPKPGRPLLERFVEARLLIAGKDGDQLEVAHEALFRVWPTLRAWLDQDREFLLWRRRLQPAVEQWTRSSTVLRDAPLDEAERWYRRRRDDLGATELELIEQSLDLRQRTRRSRRRRQRAFVGGLTGITLVVSALLAFALLQWQAATESEAQARARLARTHWLSGVSFRDDREDTVRAAHHFARSATLLPDTPRGSAARQALAFLDSGSCLRQVIAPPQPLSGAALSPDLGRVLTWTASDSIQLWDAAGGLLGEPGHAGIRGASFSARGRLLTWGGSGGVRLWDSDSGQLLARLGDDAGSRGAEFSADGQTILAWFDDGRVGLWDEQLRALNASRHADRVLQAAFTLDGRRALSLGRDNVIRLIAAESPAASQPLQLQHPTQVVGMAPGQGSLLSWDAEGRVYLWDLAQGSLQRRWLDSDGGPFNGAAFVHPDRSLLLWNREGLMQLRRLDDAAPPTEFRHTQPLAGVRVSPDGRRIAGWDVGGEIGIWSDDGRRLQRLVHQDAVIGVRFIADGRRLLSWSRDRSVRLWDLSSGRELGYPIHLRSAAAAASFDRDNNAIAGWSRQGDVRLWGLAPLAALPESADPLLDVRPAADGQSLLSIDLGGALQAWSPTGAVSEGTGRSRLEPLQQGRLSADGRWLLDVGRDRLRLWPVATDTAPVSVEELPPGLREARLSGDDSILMAWGSGDFARLWRVADGHYLGQLPHDRPLLDAAVDVRGQYAITSDAGFSAYLWDLREQRQLLKFRFEQGALGRVALSGDGRRALALSLDGEIRVWNSTDGKLLTRLDKHPAAGDALFSANGERILSWDRSGLIRQWHSADGTEAGPSMRHIPASPDAALKGLATDPDGHLLLSWDSQGSLRIWDLATGLAVSPRYRLGEPVGGAGFWRSVPPAIYAWGERRIRLWPLPQPADGNPEQRQALLTGTRLSDDGELEVLDSIDWHARRAAWPGEGAPCAY